MVDKVDVSADAAAALKSDDDARASIAVARRSMVADAVGDPKATGVATSDGLPTNDSFQNFALKLGMGTDNALSGSTYGYNPITRIPRLLEWIHRGSWLGGVAVDLVANDMTRAGVELKGAITPEDTSKVEYAASELSVWTKINEAIRWGRLYGGAVAVMLIDGQLVSDELKIDSVGKDAFKGLLVLDRWMLEPSTNDLVTDLGPALGSPTYYKIQSNAPALRGQSVHYSRIIRFDGVKLPYQQALAENLWSLSVLERLYDRLIAFDSATTGAAQLVHKSFLRTLKVKDLRNIVANGGPAMGGLVSYINIMAKFQSIEGITLVDGEDEFEVAQSTAGKGISDIGSWLGEQLSGALQIPLVRLFGQSPGGMNSSGDSDLKTYYDGIKHQQVDSMGVPVTRLYKVIAKSCGVAVKDDFKIEFRSLWQLQEKEKAEIAETIGRTVSAAEGDGTISKQTALKELKQQSHVTGIFSNITDEDIAAAESEPVLPEEKDAASADDAQRRSMEMAEHAASLNPEPAKPGKTKDGQRFTHFNTKVRDSSIHSVINAKRWLGLDVVIENPKGSVRRGGVGATAWEAVLPDDYGYIRRVTGADGDELDCFIGPRLVTAKDVYVIDQRDLGTGAFDEHKCMLGYDNREQAIAAYRSAYNNVDATRLIGGVSEFSVEQFSAWLSGGNKTKPSSAHFKYGRTADVA